jgi:AAA domain, putative AbiEii toxin, Type IV TA system
MAFELGLHPGTVWHKCDFQCHSPRDHAWSGSPDLPGGDPLAEKARQDWAESFVRAAEAAKLQAVAVSDHHDVCLSKYVIEAAQRLSSSLRVFPAVEVTCADNAQCLAIFDPSLETDRQKLILAAAGNILMAPESDAKTCTIAPARETVIGFVDNVRLTAELQTAEGILARARTAELAKTTAAAAYDQAITELDGLVDRRHQVLKTAAEKVAGKSSNLLKARVRKDRLPETYVAALCRLFDASATQQVEEGCSEWVKSVLVKDETGGWVSLRKTMLELYEAKISTGSPPEASEGYLTNLQSVLFKGARNVTERQRKRIYSNIDDERIAAIVSAIPRDAINLSYMDEGRAIDFKMASPGQQASALLELLLKQSAGTLIIDQPEDDLDNRVIMRIVELLRKSKTTRQLIFSTHNSNIVVNGDADKVIALKSAEPSSNPNVNSPRIQIDCDGAIETPAIQPAITSVMEGGREAFDLRSRKYGFEFS